MYNYKMTVSYDGSNFRGWQKQGNTDNTIQGKLESIAGSLAESLGGGGEAVDVNGAGRTDAGVHAREFFCHIDVPESIPTGALVPGLNSLLPYDISVLEAKDVPEDFHARYNAKGKRYVYCIDNGKVPDPFLRRYALHVKTPLNID